MLVLSVTEGLRVDWSLSGFFFEKLPLNTVAIRIANTIMPTPSVIPPATRNGCAALFFFFGAAETPSPCIGSAERSPPSLIA